MGCIGLQVVLQASWELPVNVDTRDWLQWPITLAIKKACIEPEGAPDVPTGGRTTEVAKGSADVATLLNGMSRKCLQEIVAAGADSSSENVCYVHWPELLSQSD